VNVAAVKFGEADLTTCDREPIHIPGSIQPHGVLLVIDRETLAVEQSAGDTASLLGLAPTILPGRTVAEIFAADAAAFVEVHLGVATEFVAPLMRLGVRARLVSPPLDLAMHAQGRTAILELEPARRTATGAGDPIERLKSLLTAVQHTAGLEECCANAAVAMRSVTGFDRAMVYRFLPNGSGVVVAEDANAGLESFLGLHYPASDIPKQARELYRRNWLRAIPNIDYVAAPLFPQTNPRTREPIDMSHCDLRSVSPIHLEYLRNMGVGASLSASIVCQNKLWGMLVLHHYSARHVSADLRVACETFAQILSMHVEAKMQAEIAALRGAARRVREDLVVRLTEATDIGGVLASGDLLRYLDATGAVVHLEGRLHRVGQTPSAAEIMALVEWLNGIKLPLFETEHLSSVYAPATQFADIASGLLAVGLSREPRDYVLWFRPQIGLTVRWAGDPSKPTKTDRHGARLTPRGSFAEWLEVTRSQSAPWSEVDLEGAEALRVVFLESVLKSVDFARRERAYEAAQAMAEELEKRVAQRTDQLHGLAADLEAAEERERGQIARDLHDDLGQTLAAARIRLAVLCDDSDPQVRSTANAVGDLIDRAGSSIRSLAAQLAPEVLHELGLVAALEWLGEEVERNFGLSVSTFDDGHPKPLAHVSRSILYRAVRELLINVAKHARTETATVEIERREDRIVVSVSDAGVGFDAQAPRLGTPRGLGLISIRERLSLIGGGMDLRSTSGNGTVAVLTAPLTPGDSTPADYGA